MLVELQLVSLVFSIVQRVLTCYAEIKNPIHLARTILDASNKPLSLRRVPPNLLVGQGATDFAWEQGIPVVPHDVLISRNAKDRYLRWREDLKRAEGIGHGHMTPASSNGSTGGDEVNPEYEEAVCARQRRDHTQAILYGTWNEGQPPSPSSSPQGSQSKEPLKKRPRYGQKTAPDVVLTRNDVPAMDHAKTGSDGNISLSNEAEGCRISLSQLAATRFDKSLTIELLDQGTAKSPPKSFTPMIDAVDDHITDTVGAIAIDMFGHIAAGSSSGGIGMKHRGRVGPAALVGIGSAVIPANDHDPDGICVAAVTSGTGEHMATTMASQKCAERLYYNARQAKGGHYIPATEDEAMESFVTDDFMGHPGVRDSSSAGAIGVMAVKKTPCGYFLHFAHNTESFALASMHSNERDAKCVMSRMGDDGKVVRGARKIRID